LSKLVNVGSLCIDLVYSVPSIVAAGETIASGERQVFAGGKGLNQSLAAARAGASVSHFGAVGEDGDMLLAVLRGECVDVAGVQQLDGPSGHAVIQVDANGQNAIVISGGSNRRLSAELIEQALAGLQAGDWVLLQNEINDVDVVMRKAAERGAAVAFNVAPPDERIRQYPVELLRLLVVNEHEAMALAGETTSAAAFDSLAMRCPQTHIVLTKGKHGLLFRDADRATTLSMQAFSVQAVDETAAGDAFVGYLLAGLVGGLPIDDTLLRASAAGALAVTAQGAAPSVPTAAAVDELLRTQNPPPIREISGR
jgi:ribokinase